MSIPNSEKHSIDDSGGVAYHGRVLRMMISPQTADAPTRNAWRRRGGILAEIADFLDAWDAPCPTMELQTSGSTGTPTTLHARKAAMRASAAMSCREFGLQPGNTALLCLPLRYIAGKMMVVRALVAGLRLVVVEPCSNPLAGPVLEGMKLDFAPLVPMQAARCLAGGCGAAQLARVRTLLLGGGFIDRALEDALQTFPSCRAYASYGMTETLSHIALRRLNGPQRSDFYTPLPGVEVSLSAEGTLCIRAPQLGIEGLTSHDLAEIRTDGRGGAATFRILGRRDAVINSGGIKIQAEELERQLRDATGLTLIAVPHPHAELGQCVALLWEGIPAEEKAAKARLLAACATLPRYHRPRLMQRVEHLPRTDTGKLARAACRELAATFVLDA